jgi:prevent-host-death family protein
MKNKPSQPDTGISTREARLHFSELLGRAEYAKERIKLTRHGKTVAYIVPPEDIEALQQQEEISYRQFAAKIDTAVEQMNNGQYLTDKAFEAEINCFMDDEP